MMKNDRIAEHLADEDLIRLLDEEGSASERTAWTGHLRGCSDCSERFDELESTGRWVGEHLATLDAGVQFDELARVRALHALRAAQAASARRSILDGRYLRAAAAIAVVIVGGLSVQPVRAWVVDRVSRLTGNVEETPVAVAEIPAAVNGAPVSFVPTASVFRIELAAAQALGSLSIEMADAGSASAQVINGVDEGLTALPAGFQVRNTIDSQASYRIRLPAGVIRRIEVVSGGKLLANRTVDSTTGTIVLDFSKVGRP